MWLHLLCAYLSSAPAIAPAEAAAVIAPQQAQAAPAVPRGQGQERRELAPELALFPPASGDLELDGAAGEDLTVLDLMLAYGELTGQAIALDREIRTILSKDALPIERPLRVPAAQVQSFVESMLAEKYVLLPLHSSEPRIVSVQSMKSSGRTTMRSQAIFVRHDQLERIRQHPAVLFTTLVELPGLDVRTLSNSLRSVIVDPNFQTILPIGDAQTLLVSGFGPWVASLVDQLQVLDAAAPARSTAVVHELIRLTHARPAEVAHLLEQALASARAQRWGELDTDGARGRGAKVLAYERLNALWVTCLEEDLGEIRTLVAMIDRE